MKKIFILILAVFLSLSFVNFVSAFSINIPDKVYAGDVLSGNIKTGEKGIYSRVYVYKENKFLDYFNLDCGSWKCFGSIDFNYQIPSNWVKGDYSIRIYDYSETDWRKRWKIAYFYVESEVEFKKAKINVQKKVKAGESLNIEIVPGTFGVSKYAYIYRDNKFLDSISLCKEFKCFKSENLTYQIPKTWPKGNYSIRIYDYSEEDWRKAWKIAYFYVESEVEFKKAKIKLSKNYVKVGESLDIFIEPGTHGIYRYVYIYRDNTYKNYIQLDCSDYKCYENINLTYQIPSNWISGNYSIRIYDYSETDWRKRWKKADFYVEGIPPTPSEFFIAKEMLQNSYLNITIKPGYNGIYSYAWLYNGSGWRSYMGFLKLCNNSWTCYEPISYSFHNSYKIGDYKLYIYDYSEDSGSKYKLFNFKIKPWCNDSDGGVEAGVKGEVRGTLESGEYGEVEDYCLDDGLVEYYCENNMIKKQEISCKCKGGKCKEIKLNFHGIWVTEDDEGEVKGQNEV